MKDGSAGQVEEVSRQELHDECVNWYRRQSPEVRPCRDAHLLKKAAQYLQREPEEPGGTFTVFPLYQALSVGSCARRTDCRNLLAAVIRAIDMLETICVNLFLQPWRKEIKTIKTFTGPFVYRLLPVLSRSAIQSVLASIGYEPHADVPASKYSLSEDADPDRAVAVGLELLLARVECYNLLELLDNNQLGPQEWQEVLQRRRAPTTPGEPVEEKTRMGLKEEEEEEEKEEKEEERTGDADRKEAGLSGKAPPRSSPEAKPRRSHVPAATDRSIIEMQMSYPDLTFKGRPLMPHKPHRANAGRIGMNAVRPAAAAAELLRRDFSCRGAKAAARGDGSKAPEVSGDAGGNVGGRTPAPGDVGNGSGDAVSEELSTPPQAVSLHLTLRSGSTAEPQPAGGGGSADWV